MPNTKSLSLLFKSPPEVKVDNRQTNRQYKNNMPPIYDPNHSIQGHKNCLKYFDLLILFLKHNSNSEFEWSIERDKIKEYRLRNRNSFVSQNEHGTPKIDVICSKCLTRHGFVKHGYPWQQQSQNLQVLNFDPIPPQGHVMSMRCEQLLDELIVHIW